MRMVCISKEHDIAIGLRLAGVQSFSISKEDEIEFIRENQELPLISTIPNSK